MNATIRLAEKARVIEKDGVVRDVSVKRRYVNLLFSLLAVHNLQSHDADVITFRRDDGFTLEVDLSVHYVSFGKESDPQEDRMWDANVDVGVIEQLVLAFIDERDDEIRKHQWSR